MPEKPVKIQTPNTDMHHNTSIGFGNLGAAATAPTFL